MATIHAVEINDGDTINGDLAGITSIDNIDTAFTGTSIDIDSVGTLYFPISRMVDSRVDSSNPNNSNLPSNLNIGAGNTGRILVEQGALLTMYHHIKNISIGSGGHLFLQGDFLQRPGGSSLGGIPTSTLNIVGGSLSLLDNGDISSTLSVNGVLKIDLDKLSVGGKSGFDVNPSQDIVPTYGTGLYLNVDILEIVGDVSSDHAIFETTDLYVGDLIENGMMIDVDSITGMQEDSGFTLFSIDGNIFLDEDNVVDPDSMDKIIGSITFIGSEASHYRIELDESGKNFVVIYSKIPEPAEFALLTGLLLLCFAAYRRRK